MVLCVVLSGACAKKKHRPKAKVKPAPHGVLRPTPGAPTEDLTPQREASERIAEIGQQELANGETDKAIHTLQEAINIDPQNGTAYYWLAKAHSLQQDYAQSLGLLEKAESLADDQSELHQKILDLKEAINGASQPPAEAPETPPPPKKGAPVYY